MWFQLVGVYLFCSLSNVGLALCCRDDGLYGQSGSSEVSGAQHAPSKPRHAEVHVSPSQTVRGPEGSRAECRVCVSPQLVFSVCVS